ncbi:MAG TPA: glycosyltransferase family 4 protein [Jatrophihabitantaceae bacterium]|nr:glycosyltransferase family 4 protein [Jatrophihabitantaceae bacterium]
MRVLMLTWEYPPIVVGGLGRHVDALARELAEAGHEVCVVTRGESGSPVEEMRDGVRVRRAAVDPLALDFTTESLLAWSQAAEHALVRAALPAVRRWRPDVVHAHDWLVAQSGITLAEVTRAPLVATMHASEAGRHQGWLPQPLNLAIHSVERWLAHRAAAVIAYSSAMRDEVSALFEVKPDHVAVVPNGIDADRWRPSKRDVAVARARHAGDGPLLVFAGRLVHEKGLQTLLDALPAIRAEIPDVRLLVAGTGVFEDKLQARARRRRLARVVDWAGFVPEEELAELLGAGDAVVVPSLYEPFGIVALESAAARTPLVLSRTGGLTDLVDAGAAAASFAPGDRSGLAHAVLSVLSDRAGAARAVRRAARLVQHDYTWSAVADATAQVYASVTR